MKNLVFLLIYLILFSTVAIAASTSATGPVSNIFGRDPVTGKGLSIETGTDPWDLPQLDASGYIPSELLNSDIARDVDVPTDFTDLSDSPASYAGQAGKTVVVNGTEDGVEFAVSTGTDDQTIDVFSLSGRTINLSLESDGEATKTLDISGIVPTADQKAALDGANSPAAGNVFATMADVAGSGVSSFNSRTGAVTPEVGDYSSFYLESTEGTITGKWLQSTLYPGGDVQEMSVGSSASPTTSNKTPLWVEKWSATSTDVWDRGAIYGGVFKQSGDNYITGITGYVAHNGGTGQTIGVHGRSQGFHTNANVFGGWFWGEAVSTSAKQQGAIGLESNVANRFNTPMHFKDLVGGGKTVAIQAVSANGGGTSYEATAAILIEREAAGAGPFASGLVVAEDSISNYDGYNEAIWLAGRSSGTGPGGILFENNHQYGIDLSAATITDDAIILSPTQTIGDGTSSYTLADLVGGSAGGDIPAGAWWRKLGQAVPVYPSSGSGFEINFDTDASVGSDSGGSGTAVFQSYDRDTPAWRGIWMRGSEFGIDTEAVRRFHLSGTGNIGLNTVDQFGSGTKVIGIADATVVPTTNPTAGGVLYSETGVLKWRRSDGTVDTFGAGGGASALNDLSDATVAAPSTGQFLIYDGVDSFDNKTMSGDATLSAAGALTIVTDAVALGTNTTGNYISSATASKGLVLTGTEGASLGLIESCSDGQVLKWTAGTTSWGCADDTGSGGSSTFAGLTDTTIATPLGGQLAVYDGTDTWDNVTVSGDGTLSSAGVFSIGADKITEGMLKSVNAATDEYCLTYETTTGDFEWQECGSGAVSDTAFGADWDSDTTTAASKNAIWDGLGTSATVTHGKLILTGNVGGSQVFSAAGSNTDTIAVNIVPVSARTVGGALSTFGPTAIINADLSATELYGTTFIPKLSGDGVTAGRDLNALNGFMARLDSTSGFIGDVNHAYTVRLLNPIFTGGSITNAYGLRIENITAGGTSNKAISTGSGSIQFGDLSGTGTRSVCAASDGTLTICP